MGNVLVSRRVLDKISGAIRSVENRCETGGVLLGYRQAHGLLAADATVPAADACADSVTFMIDGAEETRKAEALCRSYPDRPEILGIWHSHVGGSPVFSQQDRHSNQLFAQCFGEILSCIAVPGAQNSLEELIVYRILPGREEQRCEFSVRKKPKPAGRSDGTARTASDRSTDL